MEPKYDPDKFLKNDFGRWFTEKELDDKEEFVHLSDEEVKEEKGLKILTPNKLLTRLRISLAQTKIGNNSNKLKNEIRKILYLFYQQNKITKNVYNKLMKSL